MVLMLASLASAGLAVLMAMTLRTSSLLTISIPGFVIGAFFAYKYYAFDKTREREEQHRRNRRNRH
jgi:hypothetical protein